MHYVKYVLSGFLFTYMCAAQAGVIIGGTRLIYDGAKNEASLSIENPDKVEYLIQSWVESDENGKSNAPFVITPPLFRLDSTQKNILRVVNTGNLPADRESLFWLNIKSIPSVERRDNTLQLAIKTRIKLIFRPQALKGVAPETVTDKLVWKKQGDQLMVRNPTAYYMNFSSVKINGTPVKSAQWVAPHSDATFSLPKGVSGKELHWTLIGDYGAAGKDHSAGI
jgi:P pilus assembly chaperone PapD